MDERDEMEDGNSNGKVVEETVKKGGDDGGAMKQEGFHENTMDNSNQESGREVIMKQSVQEDIKEEGSQKSCTGNVKEVIADKEEGVDGVTVEGEVGSEGWIVESADESLHGDEPLSEDEDEVCVRSDKLPKNDKTIPMDDKSNFWYLLRACARGEQRIGRFNINGVDYVVMGDMAFKCLASTNLINYVAARKERRSFFHTVEEVFLCYLHYTRHQFSVYCKKVGNLHKRRIGAAAAARLEEYLYGTDVNLSTVVSDIYPPPVPISLTELLRGKDIEQLPASGWNPETYRQKYITAENCCLARNSNNVVQSNPSTITGPFEPSDSHPNNVCAPQISHSDFVNSEVHTIEYRRMGLKTVVIEGTFYGHCCYTQFLSNWLCHMRKNSHVTHSTVPVTAAQRLALGLWKNQLTVAHTYMVIEGLPPSEFYGGGFGVTTKLANWAASRELVTRLYHAGLVTPTQYNAIENDQPSLKMSKQQRRRNKEEFLIAKAALETLEQYLEIEEVPEWFLENNASDFTVEPSVIEKAKRAVERVRNSVESVENKENALLRRKRKAADLAEQDVIAAKRNRMITVLTAEIDAQVENEHSLTNKVCSSTNRNNREAAETDDVIDFVKLFDDEESSTSINKVVAIDSKADSSQKLSDTISDVPQKVTKYVDVFNDETPKQTTEVLIPKREVSTTLSEEDQECIFVAEVKHKKTKDSEIPLVTVEDDDGIRNDALEPNREPQYVPETSYMQTASSSCRSAATNADQLSTNIHDDHAGGEMDMEIEDDCDEYESKGKIESRRYSEAADRLLIRKQKELEMCQRLGVTNVASALDIYGTIKGRRRRCPQGFDAFDAHIWRHYRLNGQDDRTFSWKMEVRERLLALVRTVYENANIVAVGSTVNGCGAYNSDMDLCLCVPDSVYGYETDREYGVRILKKVFRVFAHQSGGLVRRCHCIPAKVPILKLEMGNEYSELEIDINCNNVAGIYNSHLLHYYARIDDRFPALCLLVKHWAINAGISDAMSGTFNSYSLILMVLHFLQCATMPPVLPNLQQLHPDIFNGHCGLEDLELFRNLPPLPARDLNRETVGELLIAFFDYYAKFDFANKAISIHRGCVFDRSDLAISTRRFKVFIEEPFDHQNTARCVTRVENLRIIKRAFIAARNAFLGAKAFSPLLELIGVH